jgi:hypothetical protein
MMVTGLLVLAKSTICVFPPRTIFGVVTATTTATDTNGTTTCQVLDSALHPGRPELGRITRPLPWREPQEHRPKGCADGPYRL